MKILQVHARYRVRAGEDTVVDQEAAALERAGHDVVRVLAENPPDALSSVTTLARCLDNRSAAARVEHAVQTQRPDVVHVHNTWFALSSAAVRAAASSAAPVVMTLHNFRLGCVGTDLFRDDEVCTACVGRGPWRGVRHGCYRDSRVLSAVQAVEIAVTRKRQILPAAVDRFVAPTRFMADLLMDIGLPGDRVVVKPHFVHDPGHRALPPSAATDVVVVGRLAPGKGIATLLDAWRRSAARDRFRLVVVGDGPEAPRVRDAASIGVELLGWRDRDEVTERLLGARALVAPWERYEPFGMVLIEAMSAGLPVIVTSAAGADEIVGDGAAVVPPGSAAALAAALDGLTDAIVDRQGALNRERFVQHFDEPAGTAALEALYAEALDERTMAVGR